MSAETFGFQAVSFGWRLLWRLFPPCCMGCGAPGAEICEVCLRSAERLVGKTCGRCGKTLTGAGVCPLCSGLETIWFERVRSVFVYAGLIREAIHAFKFERKLGLSFLFADAVFSVYLEMKTRVDIVLPAPISRARRAERGYNQSAWVARTFSLKTGLPYSATALQKTRDTAHQALLTEAARRTNLGGVFEAEPSDILGKSVLVVDDVLTTGTTMNECARALKAAGAASVFGITIAATKNRA